MQQRRSSLEQDHEILKRENPQALLEMQTILAAKKCLKLKKLQKHTGWQKFWNDESISFALSSVELHEEAYNILKKRSS